MKLLILAEWYYPIGGIEAFVWHLATNLPPSISATLAVCFVGQKTPLTSPNPNLHVVDVSKNTFFAVQQLVRNHCPDVIHSNHVSPIGLAGFWAARKYHIPLVLTNHQLPQYQVYGWQKVVNPCIWGALRFLDRQATKVIAPSPTVAHLLESHGISANVVTISCGVDLERFQPRDKPTVRKELALADTPILLFVGRIAKDKNIDLLLKAAAVLKDTHHFQIILVGPDATRYDASAEVAQLTADLGLDSIVTRVGFVPAHSEQLARYYAAADVFVIPSFFETQSIVTLEAMASGLAVVASNSGALPDLIEDGTNGLLFKPLDVNHLAQQLRTLLDNPARRAAMGEQSREKVASHSINLVAEQYQSAYQEVAKDAATVVPSLPS